MVTTISALFLRQRVESKTMIGKAYIQLCASIGENVVRHDLAVGQGKAAVLYTAETFSNTYELFTLMWKP